jgi:hypothetical protein
MSGPARRGPRKHRTPDSGLLTAWGRCQFAPDPPGLEHLTGNNSPALRRIAKLIDVLCDGRPGTKFFLGSVSLGILLDVHQRTAHRWIGQLEDQGIITKTWNGRPCLLDEFGKPLALGQMDGDGKPLLVDRASEFVYVGMPKTLLH